MIIIPKAEFFTMNIINSARQIQQYLPKEINTSLLILRRKKYWIRTGIIFIHIPKAAGVSINMSLYGRFMGHTSAFEISQHAPKVFNSLPSFAITRNPWSRCVSAYRFIKAEKGTGNAFAGVQKPEQYQIPEFRSFESFLNEWLIYQNLQSIDFVFKPQLPFISDINENIIVSHVGKLENIEEVQTFICEKINKKIKIGFENQTPKKVSYHDWYTPDLVDLVSSVYAKDIETFEYTFE